MNRTVQCILSTAAILLAAPLVSLAEPLAEERDCVVAPHEVVEVSSAVPGLLEQVLVERSDTVTAGQLLARLESRVENASLDLARAWASIESEVRIEETSGALDRRRHERITQLYESQAVALDDRDRAQTDAALAALRLRQAREKRWIRDLDARKAQAAVERRAVRSPIDGVVVDRYRAPGEYVENQPILRIARLDPLQVETVLPMALFGQVQAGMVAEVFAEDTPEQARRAVVRLVDRMGDAASGTFGVRLTLPNPGHRIPAGLRCRLRLLPGEATAVPAAPSPTRAEDPVPAPVKPPPARVTEVPRETPAPMEIQAPPPAARPVALHREVRSRDARRDTQPTATELHGAASQARCAMLGPLKEEGDARRLSEAANTQGMSARVDQETTSKRIGFIVLTPRQPDVDAAVALARRLRAAGVKHLEVMYRGAFANRVSLGVYAGSVLAGLRRDEVTARGVDAEVVERTRERTQWWVRVMAEGELAALPVAGTGAVSAVPTACSPSDTRRAGLLAEPDAAS